MTVFLFCFYASFQTQKKVLSGSVMEGWWWSWWWWRRREESSLFIPEKEMHKKYLENAYATVVNTIEAPCFYFFLSNHILYIFYWLQIWSQKTALNNMRRINMLHKYFCVCSKKKYWRRYDCDADDYGEILSLFFYLGIVFFVKNDALMETLIFLSSSSSSTLFVVSDVLLLWGLISLKCTHKKMCPGVPELILLLVFISKKDTKKCWWRLLHIFASQENINFQPASSIFNLTLFYRIMYPSKKWRAKKSERKCINEFFSRLNWLKWRIQWWISAHFILFLVCWGLSFLFDLSRQKVKKKRFK